MAHMEMYVLTVLCVRMRVYVCISRECDGKRRNFQARSSRIFTAGAHAYLGSRDGKGEAEGGCSHRVSVYATYLGAIKRLLAKGKSNEEEKEKEYQARIAVTPSKIFSTISFDLTLYIGPFSPGDRLNAEEFIKQPNLISLFVDERSLRSLRG